MLLKQMRSRTALLCLTLTASLGAFVGCSKSDTTTSGSGGASSGAIDVAAAQKVFTANCSRCHRLNDLGGGRAPDLSHVGAEAEHTAEWLTAFIKNPQSKKPGTRMPGFEGKIPDSDLQTLTTYLASLK